MTVSFELWELSILAFVITMIILTIYLVKMVKRLTETLNDLDKMMESKVDGILENITDITDDVTTLMEHVNSLMDPVTIGARKVFGLIGLLTKTSDKMQKKKLHEEVRADRKALREERKNTKKHR